MFEKLPKYKPDVVVEVWGLRSLSTKGLVKRGPRSDVNKDKTENAVRKNEGKIVIWDFY